MKRDEELNNCLNLLIENRVIFSQNSPDNYRMIKKNLRKIRQICAGDLGLQFQINSSFAKIEKIPEIPQTYMGIEGFADTKDYVMFSSTMAFIEETGPETPFLLKNLTDALQRIMKVSPDWTEFQTRKRIVRILKQMITLNIIKGLDGEFTNFDSNADEEALFIVTNYSRYFMRSFPDNIQILDDWHELMTPSDKNNMRIKVIQRLLFTPGICRTEETEELFNYMRHQQSFLIEYFENYSAYSFELTKNLGLLISSERHQGMKYIPDGSSSGDLLMVVGRLIHTSDLERNLYGQMDISTAQWQSIVTKAVQENLELLSKAYREKTPKKIAEDLLIETDKMGFTKKQDSVIIVTPLFARLNGKFN